MGNKGHYSARQIRVQVSFLCAAPDAKKVSVIGDFNKWNPSANPMCRSADGIWRSSFPICGGHHRYLFLVDGVPHLDPRARGVVKMKDQNEDEKSDDHENDEHEDLRKAKNANQDNAAYDAKTLLGKASLLSVS